MTHDGDADDSHGKRQRGESCARRNMIIIITTTFDKDKIKDYLRDSTFILGIIFGVVLAALSLPVYEKEIHFSCVAQFQWKLQGFTRFVDFYY